MSVCLSESFLVEESGALQATGGEVSLKVLLEGFPKMEGVLCRVGVREDDEAVDRAEG